MKMRVRGYDEHRLKDPYKFWSKVLDSSPKRERKCIATYTYVSRIDESTLKFIFDHNKGQRPDQEVDLCLLGVGNLWTIVVPKEKVSPSVRNRLHALAWVYLRSERRSNHTLENPIRIRESSGYYWVGKGWPYTPGVQVQKGKVLDTARLIDRKRYIGDTDKADEIKQKLQKVRELAPIMIRLLEAHHAGGLMEITYSGSRSQLRKELLENFDLDNVNAMDAERVFLWGKLGTYGKSLRPMCGINPWTGRRDVRSWREETDEEFRKRCVVNGLRVVREHIYFKEGVYQFKPVK